MLPDYAQSTDQTLCRPAHLSDHHPFTIPTIILSLSTLPPPSPPLLLLNPFTNPPSHSPPVGERAPPLGRESAGLPGLDLFTTQLVEDDLRQSIQSILSPKENKATENS